MILGKAGRYKMVISLINESNDKEFMRFNLTVRRSTKELYFHFMHALNFLFMTLSLILNESNHRKTKRKKYLQLFSCFIILVIVLSTSRL